MSFLGGSLLEPIKADFHKNREYNNLTSLAPTQRHTKIKEFLQKVKRNNAMREQWQMNFPDEVVKVSATLLRSVPIYFGNNTEVKSINLNNELRNATFLKTVPLVNWMLVFLENDQYKANLLESRLIQIAKNMNFQIRNPLK